METLLEIAKIAGPYLATGIAAVWLYYREQKRIENQREESKLIREAADRLTTTEWLERERSRDAEIDQLRREMDILRNTKDKEILELRKENTELKIEITDLRYKVRQLEQTKIVDDFNKAHETETHDEKA